MSTLDTTDGDWPDGLGLIGLLALAVLLSPVLLVGGFLAVTVLAVAALSVIDTFGGIAVLLGVVLAVVAAGWYYRSHWEPETAGADDPLEIARRRYARGEIGEAELERTVDRLLETEAVDGVARSPGDRRSIGDDRDWTAGGTTASGDRRREPERDADRR
jgi:uncharacterized membrane protein